MELWKKLIFWHPVHLGGVENAVYVIQDRGNIIGRYLPILGDKKKGESDISAKNIF